MEKKNVLGEFKINYEVSLFLLAQRSNPEVQGLRILSQWSPSGPNNCELEQHLLVGAKLRCHRLRHLGHRASYRAEGGDRLAVDGAAPGPVPRSRERRRAGRSADQLSENFTQVQLIRVGTTGK